MTGLDWMLSDIAAGGWAMAALCFAAYVSERRAHWATLKGHLHTLDAWRDDILRRVQDETDRLAERARADWEDDQKEAAR
jgi:hypothetical protein